MPVKLFILGRPGSGKSYAARYLKLRFRSFIRINDYEYLVRQFAFDQHISDRTQKRFNAASNGGFDVINPQVLDEALKYVAKKGWDYYRFLNYDLILIEFARSNYGLALNAFKPDFLRDAYFLYIEADLETCIERVKNRAANPQPDSLADDTYFSEETLRHYYKIDDGYSLEDDLAKKYGIQSGQAKIIRNGGLIKGFHAQLDDFIQSVLNKMPGKLPETDPVQHIPMTLHEYEAAK